MIRDYYSSGMSKNACRVKYGLTSPTMLNSWLKKYSDVLKPLSLPSETSEDEDSMANRGKEDYKEENAQLKKRVKELEKALAFSRLETEARDLMITRAEEYFNIPIRKKNLGPNSNGTGQRARLEGRACLPSVWPLSSGFLPVESRHRVGIETGACNHRKRTGNPQGRPRDWRL